MGSQEFSAEFLKILLENSKYEIKKVFTREAKLGGRNKKLIKTPVQILCEERGLQFETPKTLKNYDLGQLEDVDLIVVVGYGLILPKSFIEYPKYKCINVHPSLLPRWRGAAPIERALWAGDKETASIIMLMDEGLDTGDILSLEKIDIYEDDDPETLTSKILEKAKKQLIDVIDNIDFYSKNRKKQSENGLIYAEKLLNEDKRLNFADLNVMGAQDMKNRIRALSPKYGLMVKLKNLNEEFKIFKCEVILDNHVDQKDFGNFFIKDKKFYIVCSDGYLIPQIVQKTSGSGKKINLSEFINSLSLGR
jgi:methionyl-tRNA formyltransferase